MTHGNRASGGNGSTQLNPFGTLKATVAPAMSRADRAAHAAGSYVRSCPSPDAKAALTRIETRLASWFPTATSDSDPDMDEALRRVREHGRAIRAGMREYREWVAA
jgi:hypothetical protein